MKLKVPSLTKKAKAPQTPAAETATTAPEPKKAEKPKAAGPTYRGERISSGEEGGKQRVFNAYVSSSMLFWWRVEGPTPGDLQAGIHARWGQDGLDAICSHVRQEIHSGKCFVYVSKRGIKQAPALRTKYAEQQRTARQKAAAAQARKQAKTTEKPATANASA